MNATPATPSRRTTSKRSLTFEQVFHASLESIWELWTTPRGMEAWWGPEGFQTKVLELQARTGGLVKYAMTATAPEQVGFMKGAGLPLTTVTQGHYRTFEPSTRLVLVQRADFIPDVAPYDMATRVELTPRAKTVKMVVTIDPAHNKEWTERSAMGWKSQLKRLRTVAAAR